MIILYVLNSKIYHNTIVYYNTKYSIFNIYYTQIFDYLIKHHMFSYIVEDVKNNLIFAIVCRSC